MGKQKNKGETKMKNKSYLTLKYRLKLLEAINKQLRKELKRMKNVVSNMDWDNAGNTICTAKSL